MVVGLLDADAADGAVFAAGGFGEMAGSAWGGDEWVVGGRVVEDGVVVGVGLH